MRKDAFETQNNLRSRQCRKTGDWDHDKWEGDDWPPEVLAAFQATITATLRKGANSALAGLLG
jgi:hypothetical protein